MFSQSQFTELTKGFVCFKAKSENPAIAIPARRQFPRSFRYIPAIKFATPDGKEITSISTRPPMSIPALKKLFDQVRAQAGPPRPTAAIRRLRAAVDAAKRCFAERKYASALGGLRQVLGSSIEGDEKNEAKQLAEKIESLAAGALEKASALVGDRKYGEGIAALRGVVRDFSGTRAARDAQARLSSLARNPEVEKFLAGAERERKAAEAWEKAMKLLEPRRWFGRGKPRLMLRQFKSAHAVLERIVRYYQNTSYAATAAAKIEELMAHARFGADLKSWLQENLARSLFSRGENYRLNGRFTGGRKYYEELIKKYPLTSWAARARKIIEENS